MADISKIKVPDGTSYNIKDNSQTRSNHNHYDSDMVPLVHKKYESTSYYGTTNDWENTSWYFMSVKPDEWYKPWRVKLKVHTYCPNYSGYHSYTWSEIYGRETSMIYADWNEKYNSAHTYITFYPLKKAGFDANYGHAIGISIYNADSRTSSAYYRTFEIDYYECENCTVTILDTPVKWSAWTGTGTTNYGSLTSLDATTRGLCETNDANTTTENRIGYFAGKTGNKGIWATSLFMEDANGTYQNICTASDGTVTSSNRTTGTTKIANTNGFKVGSSIWFTNTTYSANTNINGSAVIYSSTSIFDTRYSFNTTLTAGSLTIYQPLYLVGTIDSVDNLFYLDSVWWTQTPNDPDKVYVLVGGVFDSTTSNCRATLYEQNKWYRYNGSSLVEIVNEANYANKSNAANLTTTQYGVAHYADTSGTFKNNPCLITSSTGGLEVKGHIAGDSGATGHGLYGGGGYHNAYNNILLHGDVTTGSSGIAFISDKITASTGAVTSINQPSDRGFIQYHACGITTASAEGTNPTLATSGENGRLVIGIGNDATDQLWLQTPGRTGLIHQVAATSYVIPDTGNTSGSVGSATKPIYVEGGIIKAGSYTLGAACEKAVDTTVTSGSANLVTSGAVYTAIDNLPEPMIFKGSVGTGGTITTLPTAAAANEGFTYKVITAMTTPVTAKVGDTVISNGSEWIVIPSGDEPSGTVTSVGITNGGGLTISGSPVTSSGSITVGHSNSVTAQTTQKVYPIKIDAYGHISAYGTSPTTLSGYGITDAKIASGTITLGSNTITPLTSASTLDATKLSGTIPTSCYTDTKNTAGSTDTSSKIFLIGATSQAANPQTYSQDTAYVGTDGHLYSNSKQVVNLSDTQALTNKTYNGYTLAGACAKAVVTSVDTSASLPTSNAVKTFVEGKGYVTTDTKNTAGSTDTSSKIFLIGATSQAANPQTYSDNEVYATSGVLTTKSVQVGGTAATMQYNSTTQAIEFVFT